MPITERQTIRDALARALKLDDDRDAAVAAVASTLCLPVEAVAEELPAEPVEA